ncbi:MAG: YgaP family membrane protein [Candidatus Krumholzibacteriia bacterium]
MTLHRYLRLVAGTFVLASLALARFVSPNWLWFTAFVGVNLLQSAFTDWCPLMTILRRAGVPETAARRAHDEAKG